MSQNYHLAIKFILLLIANVNLRQSICTKKYQSFNNSFIIFNNCIKLEFIYILSAV